MKVSTRGRNGLRALVDMTINSNNAPVSLVQVANRQKISLNYLEQVFGTLRKAGIVVSVKGAGGGYKLARDAESITVKEVLEALEGTFSIIDRIPGEEQDAVQEAIEKLVWSRIDEPVNIEAVLGIVLREGGDAGLVGVGRDVAVGNAAGHPDDAFAGVAALAVVLETLADQLHDPRFVGVGDRERFAARRVAVGVGQLGDHADQTLSCRSRRDG